ncbi:MAG: hypothetical protein QMD82_03870 [bacterium]|nr:hypothetical protein [bacterium]
MFFILSLISYFVPLTTEDFLKPELQRPINDRIYIQEIPFLPNCNLRFWNCEEFEKRSGKIDFIFIKDSLRSPEVLLYSLRGERFSEVGGFLKTPIEKIEYQSVILYSNLKIVDSSTSFLLLAFKHTGKVNFNISYAQIEGKNGYALSSSYRNLFAFYRQGEFNEAGLGFIVGNLSAYYKIDGKIHNAIFHYKGISLGLSYCEKLYPYLDVKHTLNFLTLRIGYTANNFYNRLENPIYGSIKLEKNGYFASIDAKIGKEGIYYLENGELRGGPYIAGISGGIQKEYLQLSFNYFMPSQGKLALRVSPAFEFKKGEIALEPAATIFYDHRSKILQGKIGLSLFLFKAIEARFSYDLLKGAVFGIGVNLFD